MTWLHIARLGIAAPLALNAPGAVDAQPAHVRIDEFAVSSNMSGVCNVHSIDHLIAPDRSTALWFSEAENLRLGRIDLITGSVTKFDLPKVDRITFKTQSLDAFPQDQAISGPCDFVMSDDGQRLWFNYQAANSIGYIETSPPFAIKLVPMHTPASLPMAMQMGGDGNIYVSLTAANKIARVNPRNFEVTEFSLPEARSGIIGGTASVDGKSHWFILMNKNALVNFDYLTGEMKITQIPIDKAAPLVVRAYDDGLWMAMYGANSVVHWRPENGQFTNIELPSPDSLPMNVITGRDNDIYGMLRGTDEVVRIDRKTARITGMYHLPSSGGSASDLKQGPDGAIWVTSYISGKISRLWIDSFGRDPGFPQERGSGAEIKSAAE